MWFLWIFGGQVEDRLGHFTYLVFYLICGLGSGIAQLAFSWGSKTPAIGASGAIAGVLGAYIVFFPSSRILTLVPLFIIWFTAQIPALVFIGLWFVVQFLSGINSVGAASMGGVAWWAHVGGFLLGVLIAQLYRARPRPRRPVRLLEAARCRKSRQPRDCECRSKPTCRVASVGFAVCRRSCGWLPHVSVSSWVL
jgi:membrane associated rhomboid family serine protease